MASLPLVFLQVGEEGDEEDFEDNDLDLEEFEVRALLRRMCLSDVGGGDPILWGLEHRTPVSSPRRAVIRCRWIRWRYKRYVEVLREGEMFGERIYFVFSQQCMYVLHGRGMCWRAWLWLEWYCISATTSLGGARMER